MEISSDSSDTVILSPRLSPQLSSRLSPQLSPQLSPRLSLGLTPQISPRLSPQLSPRLSPNNDINEPSDSEIENILRKYSSTASSIESKESSSSQKNILRKKVTHHDAENAVDIPYKRLKMINKNSNESGGNKFERMGYVLEDCLSDSEDNLQNEFGSKFTSSGKIRKECNDMFKELYGKYVSPSRTESNKITKNSYTKANNSKVLSPGPSSSGAIVDLCVISDDDLDEDLQKLSPKTAAKGRKQKELDKRKERALEKEKKRVEAEQRKALKNMEKERKKEEMERQKALKTAMKAVEQSTNPDECIKHMLVEMDPEIFQKVYGEGLKVTLKNNVVSLRSTSQVFPNLISWCRKVQTIENMSVQNSEVREKQFLVIMDEDEFIRHTKSNSLMEHVRDVITVTQCKQLTLAVFGVDKAKGDQDLAIVEVQLLTKCYFRFVKNTEDLAALVMELTKAIAQIPYKLKKEEKYQLQSEYFNDSNKDTVRVDKNGNGLGRLWHQMLTMFPLARLETAEAITAMYPTPKSLFEAYDNCQTKKEELLQDLPIRRAHGPCATVRRIGPELSRKCYNFFCAEDNILI